MNRKNNNKTVACTIVCMNYICHARCLRDSYAKHNQNSDFVVLVLDGSNEETNVLRNEFNVLIPTDLKIDDFQSLSFIYNILELSTNVKPTLLKYLLDAKGYSNVIYFDPDINIYNSIEILNETLKNKSIILTPHLTKMITDDKKQSEQHYLNGGIFNLGFIAVSNSIEGKDFLNWWEKRCLTKGFSEVRNGLFVDQKWVNFVPAYYESHYILRHPGCNMAYWNLHYRFLSFKNGSWIVNDNYPLIFYHFSGFQYNNIDVLSKFQNRFDLKTRPDLQNLFNQYREELRSNGFEDYSRRTYGYNYYSNGEAVSNLARKIYWGNYSHFKGIDPFDAQKPFYNWMSRINANGGGKKYESIDSSNVNRNDFKLKVFNKMLRMILYMFGVDKYMMFLKYIAYIGILQNQKEIFHYDQR